jgi:hypothetical protein
VFLIPRQLYELTGYTQPAAQIRWLQRNGIRHFVRADGRPVVTKDALQERRAAVTVEPTFTALRVRH